MNDQHPRKVPCASSCPGPPSSGVTTVGPDVLWRRFALQRFERCGHVFLWVCLLLPFVSGLSVPTVLRAWSCLWAGRVSGRGRPCMTMGQSPPPGPRRGLHGSQRSWPYGLSIQGVLLWAEPCFPTPRIHDKVLTPCVAEGNWVSR